MLTLAHGFAPVYDICAEDPEMAPLAQNLMGIMLETAVQLNKASIKEDPE